MPPHEPHDLFSALDPDVRLVFVADESLSEAGRDPLELGWAAASADARNAYADWCADPGSVTYAAYRAAADRADAAQDALAASHGA